MGRGMGTTALTCIFTLLRSPRVRPTQDARPDPLERQTTALGTAPDGAKDRPRTAILLFAPNFSR